MNTEARLTAGQVARLLGVSPKRVYQMIDEGKLAPSERTPLGMLFARADIDGLIATRAAAKAARAEQAEAARTSA